MNNCWASMFQKPWAVDQEFEMDFFSGTFRKRPSVSVVPSKTTYISLLLNFSVPDPFIGKHDIGSCLEPEVIGSYPTLTFSDLGHVT